MVQIWALTCWSGVGLEDLLSLDMPAVSLDEPHQALADMLRVQLDRQGRLEHLAEGGDGQAGRSCSSMVPLHCNAHRGLMAPSYRPHRPLHRKLMLSVYKLTVFLGQAASSRGLPAAALNSLDLSAIT